mgnify:FL=1|jgi:hypothetical protein
MKPVYVVQVVYKGRAAEMHAEAQRQFPSGYLTNGVHEVRRTKRSADGLAADFATLGDVAVATFMRPESLDEAFMHMIGGAA